jgi:hypothetical protein
MALINDPSVTARLSDIANSGTIDVNEVIALLNSTLPPAQQISSGISGINTGIYKRFSEFDKVNAKVEVVTTGLWTDDAGSITTFFTGSDQTASPSGNYYYNVYSKNPATDVTAEVEFALAYGHIDGSGSISLDNDDDSTLATRGTYSQYRSILLSEIQNKFEFPLSSSGVVQSDDIWIINVSRSRYREEMDAGNWSLKLSGSIGASTFIDDSGKKFGDAYGKAGRVFKVVEGTLNLGTQNEATVINEYAPNGQGFGYFYPDRGIIILNPSAMTSKGAVSAPIVTTTDESQNQKFLLTAIATGADFQARRTENISTQHFFVRATNREYNYSNNPTYIDSTTGRFSEPAFEVDPMAFITTIGLYNDSNEMIAVAKTSQPIKKSFDSEILIKIKLSF